MIQTDISSNVQRFIHNGQFEKSKNKFKTLECFMNESQELKIENSKI